MRVLSLLPLAVVLAAAAPAETPTRPVAPHHQRAVATRHGHVTAHRAPARHLVRRHHLTAHSAASAGAAVTLLPSLAFAAAPPPPAPPPRGSESGLPIPRFAALRSDEVSFRSGPGTQYPVEWIYQRRDLPVEIEREFQVWRLVAEPDGTRGWVHEAMLTGRRGFLIIGTQPVTLRATADAAGKPIAILEPQVVGHLLRCPTADWCEVSVKSYRGWLRRDQFWGTLADEKFSS